MYEDNFFNIQQLQPLVWPQSLNNKSFLSGFPLIGDEARAYARLKRQLIERPSLCLTLWDKNIFPEEARVKLFEIFKEEMGWVNTHFIPNDQVKALLFNPNLDMRSVSALSKIEQLIEREITDIELEHLTLGELIKIASPEHTD
jgi:hypothetical protein